MAIGKLGDSLPIARILNSEENQLKEIPQESLKTGIASVQNSFVDASKDKSLLPAASSAPGYGAVSGLEVTTNSISDSPKLNVTPGTGVNHFGEVIQTDGSRNSFFDGKQLTAADFQREQDYKRHGNAWSGLKGGSAAAQVIIDTFRSEGVLGRLSNLTGISSEELLALFNKYALKAGELPNPPDHNVLSFVQDPAFSSYAQQDILSALYGQ